jgi:hypothetical protein
VHSTTNRSANSESSIRSEQETVRVADLTNLTQYQETNMNLQHRILSLIGAALLFATASPSQNARTGYDGNPSAEEQSGTTDAWAVQKETFQMVSARVSLKQSLDASRVKPGDQIRTVLAYRVALKDGTELPAGTVILGVVAEDDMQLSGRSKLALCFDEAEPKDGTIIPIKATIVDLFQPESQDMSGNPIVPNDEVKHTFDGRPDAVDEIGVLPDVDLHSDVTSNNSGVLVTTSKFKHNMRGSRAAVLRCG